MHIEQIAKLLKERRTRGILGIAKRELQSLLGRESTESDIEYLITSMTSFENTLHV